MNDTEFRKLVRDIREVRRRQAAAQAEAERQLSTLAVLLHRLDEESDRLLALIPVESSPK